MKAWSLAVALSSVALALGCQARDSETATTPHIYQTRSSQGDISLRLTPRVSTPGRLTIDVAADTHSGDLAEVNLRGAMALRVNGQVYRPIEASSLAGHHAEGSVTFALPDVPDHFTITIAGVRNMDELRFEWP